MITVQVLSVDDMAALLSCSAKTVEDLARRGELPGLKPGGGWIFPAGALAQRLDELALQHEIAISEAEVLALVSRALPPNVAGNLTPEACRRGSG